MGAILRDRMVSVLLVLGVCAIGPAAVLHFIGGRQVQVESGLHFLPIAVSAGLAAAAALALTAVGARRGDGRAIVVGTAFSAMAALLAVHGLTTPGMLVGDNGVIAFSGAATLPVGGAVLALAAVPGLRGRCDQFLQQDPASEAPPRHRPWAAVPLREPARMAVGIPSPKEIRPPARRWNGARQPFPAREADS